MDPFVPAFLKSYTDTIIYQGVFGKASSAMTKCENLQGFSPTKFYLVPKLRLVFIDDFLRALYQIDDYT